MFYKLTSYLTITLLTIAAFCSAEPIENEKETNTVKEKSGHKTVLMRTSMGDIKIELYEDKAPESVKNFLSYVNEGFYNGTIFHRVIDNFMIQGGGFTKDFKQKETHAPIVNEANNGLKNEVGTLAMARTSVVNSATSQFFINVKGNSFLDYQGDSPSLYGYAVFGKVIDGMDVVNKIKKAATGSYGPHQDVPKETIEILDVKEL
ncbi:MAG TPA: peptidylprolyl isomerase [Parachlamydiaceae bacterium]|nr:peptidylprolyl isomerase [Parachlamydiaceae bacterium]